MDLGWLRRASNPTTLLSYYLMYEPQITGATGFDRMVSVVVACPGRPIGLVNQLGKTLTANNDVAGRVGFAAPVRMAA
jgi:hypothetical protein